MEIILLTSTGMIADGADAGRRNEITGTEVR